MDGWKITVEQLLNGFFRVFALIYSLIASLVSHLV